VGRPDERVLGEQVGSTLRIFVGLIYPITRQIAVSKVLTDTIFTPAIELAISGVSLPCGSPILRVIVLNCGL
jgi:hypothetical protein